MQITGLVKGNAKQMRVIAQDAIDLIQTDAERNLTFQNNKKNQPLSQPYKKYKNNKMNKLRGGGKLKGFRNQSITPSLHANMKLTGRTFNGMRASGKTDTAIITYDRGEIVLGNQKRGYDIYDLRKKNLEIVAEEYGKRILDRNIKKYVSKTTIIK